MQEFKQTGPDQPVFLTPSPPRLFARLTSLSRAGEWWEYKLVPGLAVLYATAFRTGAGAIEVAQMCVLYVVALAAGAAFVSAVNDLSDRDDDRRAGKPDRIRARIPMATRGSSPFSAAGCSPEIPGASSSIWPAAATIS